MKRKTNQEISGRRSSTLATALSFTFLLLIGLVMFLPLFLLIMGSLSKTGAFSDMFFSLGEYSLPRFMPEERTLERYYDVLVKTPQYLKLFWNSVILTLPAVAGQVAVSALAGYGFAKFRFRGKELLFSLFVVLMLMPAVVTVVPNFLVSGMLGITDTYMSVILPGVFSAFGVFLMRQYISGFPDSVLEAARSDGAGEMKIFFSMVLPNCKGAIAALAILTLIDLWNQVELPLALLSNPDLMPLSVYLGKYAEQMSGIGLVCCMLFALPVLLSFLAGEEYLVDGIEHSQF